MKIELAQPGTDIDRETEQIDYLEGVLWSDTARRLNASVDTSEIDGQHGTHTAAFWRGLVEAGGTISIASNGTDRRYPRVELRGCYPVLSKFLDYLGDALQPAVMAILAGAPMDWDEQGKFRTMASSGYLRITGRKAQDVCRVLYPPDSTVGMESVRAKVDEIVAWTPRY
jgi:hypothetical protein